MPSKTSLDPANYQRQEHRNVRLVLQKSSYIFYRYTLVENRTFATNRVMNLTT
jgi:hypothetical protein